MIKKIENDLEIKNIKKYMNSIQPVYRVTLKKNEKFFGPGISQLLHYIEELGTIQRACEKMGMSYSKAWKIIKRVETEMGFKVLDTTIGGATGGKSQISEECKFLLQCYDKMLNELEKQTEKIFLKYFS